MNSQTDTDELESAEKGRAISSTCAQHMAQVCLSRTPSHRSTQLCLLGLGGDVDGLVAHLIFEEMKRTGRERLFPVILPDKVDAKVVAAVGMSVHYRLTQLLSQHSAAEGDLSLNAERNSFWVGSSESARTDGNSELVPLHILQEGSSTKDRCRAFQLGGVAFTTSRMFCADLLHRRLAPELVSICVVCFPHSGFAGDASGFKWTSSVSASTMLVNIAFFIEIMLLGGNSGKAFLPLSSQLSKGDGAAPYPKVLLVSDHPSLMQYLVDRHHVGRERFTAQLHVGDIQLFPRFRLNFVQHFEALASRKPLTADRLLVAVSTSTQILDGLLCKILHEVHSELQSLQRRLQPPGTSGNGSSGAERSYGSDDADLRRLQPRVRMRFEQSADGTGERIQYDSSHAGRRCGSGGSSAQDQAARVESGNASWRDPLDVNHILFEAISANVSADVEALQLDADLSTALDGNGPSWPFRPLVESLVDVRRLRRVARGGSQFDFFLTLQSVLRRRMPSGRTLVPGPPPPTAAWTLSSCFSDVITVATQRIGRLVEWKPTRTPALGVAVSLEAIDVDADDDTEADVDGTARATVTTASASGGGASAASSTILVPGEEEQDRNFEVAHRLTLAWLRDQHRVMSRRTACTSSTRDSLPGKSSTCSSATPSSTPAILIIVFSNREVVSFAERLLYDREQFASMQLTHFLRRYQRCFGARPAGCVGVGMRGADGSVPDDGNADEDLAEEEEDLEDELAGLGVGAQDEHSVTPGGTAQPAVREAAYCNGDDDCPGSSLHHILLSQAAEPPALMPSNRTSGLAASPVSATSPQVEREPRQPTEASAPSAAEAKQTAVQLCVRLLSPDLAVLSSKTSPDSQAPCVVIANGLSLRSGDLLSMTCGQHSRLRDAGASFATAATAESVDGSTPASRQSVGGSSTITVRRIVLTRQSIPLLREMETLQDELAASVVRQMKVQVVSSTFSDADGKRAIEEEKSAFETVARAKATLTGRLLMDRSSIRQTEEMLEAGLTVDSRAAGGSGTGGVRQGHRVVKIQGQFHRDTNRVPTSVPMVVFDEREFRSTLPFFLFHQGLDLVPLTLNTADYVLSPDYAMERKGVRDFYQSVAGGRINQQLAALARRYTHPLLLIEFDRAKPFRLCVSSSSKASNAAGSASRGGGVPFAFSIYASIAKLAVTHPRVSLLWSRSPAHSAGMVATLKCTVAAENCDPSDSSLTGGVYSATEEGGKESESEAQQATRQYAMRVVAKFPGVHAANAEKIMRLCGTLAGLAAISKDSLANAIGREDAEILFSFLHKPFAEEVL